MYENRQTKGNGTTGKRQSYDGARAGTRDGMAENKSNVARKYGCGSDLLERRDEPTDGRTARFARGYRKERRADSEAFVGEQRTTQSKGTATRSFEEQECGRCSMIHTHTCKHCGSFLWAFTTKRFIARAIEHYVERKGERSECVLMQKAKAYDWKGAF